MNIHDGHNGLRITEIRIKLIDDPTHYALKAFASICLNDSFVVRNVKVIRPDSGSDRIFASFPSTKLKNGRFTDVAHPADNDCRAWLERPILAAYYAEVEARAERREREEASHVEAPRSSCGHPTEEVLLASYDSELRDAG